MKFNFVILALLCLASSSSIKSRYYEGIKKPQNVLDFTALFQKNLKYENLKEWADEPLLESLRDSLKGKSSIIASAQIIRGWVDLAKNNINFQNLLKKNEWFVYKSNENSFAIFINKEIYRDAINQTNKKLNLEKIGLSKKLTPITLEANPLETLKKEFSTPKSKTLGPLNIDDFYSIFSANSNIKKRAIIIGHGSFSKSIAIGSIKKFDKETTKNTSIANLTIDQFIKLPKEFAKIGGDFLVFQTCYGYGWNSLTVNLKNTNNLEYKIGKNTNPFPIVFLGGGDAGALKKSQEKPALFFKDLHIFITKEVKGNWNKWLKRKPWLDIKTIKKENGITLGQVMSHISRKDIFGQPFFQFPGKYFFRPVSTTKKIIFLTNSVLLNHEIKTYQNIKSGKTKDNTYTIPNVTTDILLYTGAVRIPIALETDPIKPPTIASCIAGPAQHYFAKITQKKHSHWGNINVLLSRLPYKFSNTHKLFFFADFICENHREINKNYPILPTNIKGGETIHLKNVIIKTTPKSLQKHQIFPEYICKTPTDEQYYYAIYNPKTSPKIQFKTIEKTKAKEKISQWMDEATPIKQAVYEGTTVETPKKIRNLIDKTLKIINLKKESLPLKQKRKENEEKLISQINKESKTIISVITDAIKIIDHLTLSLEKGKQLNLEQLEKIFTIDRDIQKELNQTANKLEKTANSFYNNVIKIPTKDKKLLNRILIFLKKAPSICKEFLKHFDDDYFYFDSWEISCKWYQRLLEKINQPENKNNRPVGVINKWKKLSILRATIPNTLKVKKSLEELFTKTNNAIKLFLQVTCLKHEQESKNRPQ